MPIFTCTRESANPPHATLNASYRTCAGQPCTHALPLDVLEESINVFRRRSAVVHLIRVLVHVHHQDRNGGGRSMRVIGHPVIFQLPGVQVEPKNHPAGPPTEAGTDAAEFRSEEHTSELQSQSNLVCRLLLEKKKKR